MATLRTIACSSALLFIAACGGSSQPSGLDGSPGGGDASPSLGSEVGEIPATDGRAGDEAGSPAGDAAACAGTQHGVPLFWHYLAPGCGPNAPAPICASYQADAGLSQYACGCDGKLHSAGDGWATVPWAYLVPARAIWDAGGYSADGYSCDPTAGATDSARAAP